MGIALRPITHQAGASSTGLGATPFILILINYKAVCPEPTAS